MGLAPYDCCHYDHDDVLYSRYAGLDCDGYTIDEFCEQLAAEVNEGDVLNAYVVDNFGEDGPEWEELYIQDVEAEHSLGTVDLTLYLNSGEVVTIESVAGFCDTESISDQALHEAVERSRKMVRDDMEAAAKHFTN